MVAGLRQRFRKISPKPAPTRILSQIFALFCPHPSPLLSGRRGAASSWRTGKEPRPLPKRLPGSHCSSGLATATLKTATNPGFNRREQIAWHSAVIHSRLFNISLIYEYQNYKFCIKLNTKILTCLLDIHQRNIYPRKK